MSGPTSTSVILRSFNHRFSEYFCASHSSVFISSCDHRFSIWDGHCRHDQRFEISVEGVRHFPLRVPLTQKKRMRDFRRTPRQAFWCGASTAAIGQNLMLDHAGITLAELWQDTLQQAACTQRDQMGLAYCGGARSRPDFRVIVKPGLHELFGERHPMHIHF